MEKRPHVVILGGGFGGLFAAQALARTAVRVTLVDRANHHTFQPLLYQVATAGLTPSDIAVPIRRILRHQENVVVLLGTATAIDAANKCVRLEGGDDLAYDHLIVATGATHSYFGHPEWAERAPGLKTIDDALEIRKRVLFAFEAAEREQDRERFRGWLTFVVVGGGATGVELAGTLVEIARKTLARDFRHIDPKEARVLLLEGSNNLLAAFGQELRDYAKTKLTSLGVEVRLDARVTAIDETGVALGEERIPARTVLWAAGVAASPIAATIGASVDRAGRVEVTPELTVPDHPEIHVIGDAASLKQDGVLIPGVARAAIDGGRHAAKNIARGLRGEAPLPFKWHNPGMLATIGRGSAVAEVGSFKLGGFLAWVAWLVLHIVLLIGFRNRLFVITEWAIAYLTYDRGARLITGKLPKLR